MTQKKIVIQINDEPVSVFFLAGVAIAAGLILGAFLWVILG
jgi:hypothetical protein